MFHFLHKLVILSNANRRSTPVGAKVNGSRFVTLTSSNLLILAAKTQTSLVLARLLAALSLCSLLFALFSIFNPFVLRTLPLGKWESLICGFGNSSSPSLRGGVGLPTEGRKCCVRLLLRTSKEPQGFHFARGETDLS